jgi:hypothetical protein
MGGEAVTNQSIIYLVAACSAVFGLAAYIAFILVPAWTSYSRLWERLAASFLTLYVLAAFVLLGVGGGLTLAYFWGELTA